MTTTNGQLLVDKASGPTSHDVVARVRNLLGERRVGHAGTLDPLASGLLILGVGPSTRLLRFAQAQVKRYSGEVTFGVATDSLDADGEVVARAAVPELSVAAVNELAASFLGAQLQEPPMVSARKVNGQRLYALARRGETVERAAREVHVSSFHLAPGRDEATWTFEVTCSVGTYVRVLLSDLATALGTVGHLSALRREASGRHDVAHAWTLDALEEALRDQRPVLGAPVSFVDDLVQVRADARVVSELRQGKRVSLDVEASGEVAVLDLAGRLVAVVEPRGESWKPNIVLPPETSEG
ncbi:MAG: tRNA pseudouridine(55) synthase TruB [Acidobacteriota bacterium]|nr:tRNA pseudouridine(55) synthase TruB [Acidobacteriota bacterium]